MPSCGGLVTKDNMSFVRNTVHTRTQMAKYRRRQVCSCLAAMPPTPTLSAVDGPGQLRSPGGNWEARLGIVDHPG